LYNVYILSNNGAGLLSLINTYQLRKPGYGLATADLNGDGNLDLIVFSTDPITQEWSYSVLLGNGNGSFQTPVFYPQNVATGAGTYSLVVGDFNHDGKLDIAASLGGASGDESLVVPLGNGDGIFASPVYYFDGGSASMIMAADFNGDGNIDIAAGSVN
jgi:FG-GAP-like repeat